MIRIRTTPWPNETPAERGKANRWIAGAVLFVAIVAFMMIWSALT